MVEYIDGHISEPIAEFTEKCMDELNTFLNVLERLFSLMPRDDFHVKSDSMVSKQEEDGFVVYQDYEYMCSEIYDDSSLNSEERAFGFLSNI